VAIALSYRIEYSPACVDHLGELSARDERLVIDAVNQHRVNQPCREARNRKRMRPNPVAPWELRVGRFRVYYDVVEEPEAIVQIIAIGIKEREVVTIGGEEVEL
jgi:mRNA-degrading endonuclease RelE of RelBE toxin-antitoxin system